MPTLQEAEKQQKELEQQVAKTPLADILQRMRAIQQARSQFATPQQRPEIQKQNEIEAAKVGLSRGVMRIRQDRDIERHVAALDASNIRDAETLFDWMAFQLRSRLKGREFQYLTDQDNELWFQLSEELGRAGEGLPQDQRMQLNNLGLRALQSVTVRQNPQVARQTGALTVEDLAAIDGQLPAVYNRERNRQIREKFQQGVPDSVLGINKDIWLGGTEIVGGFAEASLGGFEAIANVGVLLGTFGKSEIPEGTFVDFLADAVNFARSGLGGVDDATLTRQLFRLGKGPNGEATALRSAGELLGVVAAFKGAGSARSPLTKIFGLGRSDLSQASRLLRHKGVEFTTGFLMGAGRERGADFMERMGSGIVEGTTLLVLNGIGGALGGATRRQLEKVVGQAGEQGLKALGLGFVESATSAIPWVLHDPNFRQAISNGDWKSVAQIAVPTLGIFGALGAHGSYRQSQQVQGAREAIRAEEKRISESAYGRHLEKLRQARTPEERAEIAASLGTDFNAADLQAGMQSMIFEYAKNPEFPIGQKIRKSLEDSLGVREKDWEPGDKELFDTMHQGLDLLFEGAELASQTQSGAPVGHVADKLAQRYEQNLVDAQGKVTRDVFEFARGAVSRALAKRDAEPVAPANEDLAQQINSLLTPRGARKWLEQIGGEQKLERRGDLKTLAKLVQWHGVAKKGRGSGVAGELLTAGKQLEAAANAAGVPFGDVLLEVGLRTDGAKLGSIKPETVQKAIEHLIEVSWVRAKQAGRLERFQEEIASRVKDEQAAGDILDLISRRDAALGEGFRTSLGSILGQDPNRQITDVRAIQRLAAHLGYRMSSQEMQRVMSQFVSEQGIRAGDLQQLVERVINQRPVRTKEDLEPSEQAAMDLLLRAIPEGKERLPDSDLEAVLSVASELMPGTPAFERQLGDAVQHGRSEQVRELVDGIFTTPNSSLLERPAASVLRSLDPARRRANQARVLDLMAKTATAEGGRPIEGQHADAIALMAQRLGIDLPIENIRGKTLEEFRQGLQEARGGAQMEPGLIPWVSKRARVASLAGAERDILELDRQGLTEPQIARRLRLLDVDFNRSQAELIRRLDPDHQLAAYFEGHLPADQVAQAQNFGRSLMDPARDQGLRFRGSELTEGQKLDMVLAVKMDRGLAIRDQVAARRRFRDLEEAGPPSPPPPAPTEPPQELQQRAERAAELQAARELGVPVDFLGTVQRAERAGVRETILEMAREDIAAQDIAVAVAPRLQATRAEAAAIVREVRAAYGIQPKEVVPAGRRVEPVRVEGTTLQFAGKKLPAGRARSLNDALSRLASEGRREELLDSLQLAEDRGEVQLYRKKGAKTFQVGYREVSHVRVPKPGEPVKGARTTKVSRVIPKKDVDPLARALLDFRQSRPAYVESVAKAMRALKLDVGAGEELFSVENRTKLATRLVQDPVVSADMDVNVWRRLATKADISREQVVDILFQRALDKSEPGPETEAVIKDWIHKRTQEVTQLGESSFLVPEARMRALMAEAGLPQDLTLYRPDQLAIVKKSKAGKAQEWERQLAMAWTAESLAEMARRGKGALGNVPEARREAWAEYAETVRSELLGDIAANRAESVKALRRTERSRNQAISKANVRLLEEHAFRAGEKPKRPVTVKRGASVFNRAGELVLPPLASGTGGSWVIRWVAEGGRKVAEIEGAEQTRLRLSEKLVRKLFRDEFDFLQPGEEHWITSESLASVGGQYAERVERLANKVEVRLAKEKLLDQLQTRTELDPLEAAIKAEDAAMESRRQSPGEEPFCFCATTWTKDGEPGAAVVDKVVGPARKRDIFLTSYWSAGKTGGKFKKDLVAGIPEWFGLPEHMFNKGMLDNVLIANRAGFERMRSGYEALFGKGGALEGLKRGDAMSENLYRLVEQDSVTAARWLKALDSPELSRRYRKLRSVNETLRQQLEATLRAKLERGEFSPADQERISALLEQPFGMLEGWMPRVMDQIQDPAERVELFGKELVDAMEAGEVNAGAYNPKVYDPLTIAEGKRPDQIFRRKVKDGDHYVRDAVWAYARVLPGLYRYMMRQDMKSFVEPVMVGARDLLAGRGESTLYQVEPNSYLWKPGQKTSEKGVDVSPETHRIIANHVNDQAFVAVKLDKNGKPIEGAEEVIPWTDVVDGKFKIRAVGLTELGPSPKTSAGRFRQKQWDPDAVPELMTPGAMAELKSAPVQKERLKALENWAEDIFGYNPRGHWEKISDALANYQYHTLIGLLNPQAAATNLGQLWFTVSRMGPKYVIQGMKELASKEGQKVLREYGVTLDSAALTEVQRHDLTDPASVNKMVDKLTDGKVDFRTLKPKGGLNHLSFFLFDLSEQLVRGSTFLAARRKALDAGMTEAVAARYARQMEARTMFQYDKIYSPRALRSRKARFATVLGTFTHRAFGSMVEALTAHKNLEPNNRAAALKEYGKQVIGVASLAWLVEELSEFYSGGKLSLGWMQSQGTQAKDIPIVGPMIDAVMLEHLPAAEREKEFGANSPLDILAQGRAVPIPSAGLGPSPIVELINELVSANYDAARTGEDVKWDRVLRNKRQLLIGRTTTGMLEVLQMAEHYAMRSRVEEKHGGLFQGTESQLGSKNPLVDQIVYNERTGMFQRIVDGKPTTEFTPRDLLVDHLIPGSLLHIQDQWDINQKVRMAEGEQRSARDNLWERFLRWNISREEPDRKEFVDYLRENLETFGFTTYRDISNWLGDRAESDALPPIVRSLVAGSVSASDRVKYLSPGGKAENLVNLRPELAAQVLRTVDTRRLTAGEAKAYREIVQRLVGRLSRDLS